MIEPFNMKALVTVDEWEAVEGHPLFRDMYLRFFVGLEHRILYFSKWRAYPVVVTEEELLGIWGRRRIK